MNLRTVRKLFRRSPTTFRPMARWIWNDRLDPDRLVEQYDAILDAGFGGAFIRPGAGLPTNAYLNDAWFEAMAAVTRRARRKRTSLWIAEDFENAFTRAHVRDVVRDRPEHAALLLTFEDRDAAAAPSDRPPFPDVIAAFAVTRDVPSATAARGRRDPVQLEPIDPASASDRNRNDRVIVFHVQQTPDRLNVFKREATRDIIARTHERYRAHLKRYFGNTLGLALFLNAGAAVQPGAIPWDRDLPALFRETRGYDLLENLPALFFDLPGCHRTRYDFWTLVAELTREGFVEPYADWCRETRIAGGIAFDGSGSAAAAVARGGSRMAAHARCAYALQTCPIEQSNDASRQTEHLLGLVACKEAQSVRRQFANSGVAWVGETANADAGAPETIVATGKPLAAHGVNYASYAAAYSSLRGARKPQSGALLRDTEFHRNMLHTATNEVARLAWLLGHGDSAAEVLLLHPFTSLQAAYRPTPGDDAPHHALERHLAALSRALLDAQIDFDYADEELLERHGSVSHRLLTIGRREYRIVVLPPLLNIRAGTLIRLQDFAMIGGLVVAVGSVPRLVDGRESGKVKTFFQEYGHRITQGVDLGDYQPLVERLVQFDARTVNVQTPSGEPIPDIATHRRHWEDLDIIFLMNQSAKPVTGRVAFTARDSGVLEEWNPAAAETRVLAKIDAEEFINRALRWEPFQARLLVTVPENGRMETAPPDFDIVDRIVPAWRGVRTAPNVAVPVRCRLAERESRGDWTTPDNVRRIVSDRLQNADGPVSARTQWTFTIQPGAEPPAGCEIVVERSQDLTIRLNEAEVSVEEPEPIPDPVFARIPLPALDTGRNVIEIWRLYADPGDMQPPWLLGPFTAETADADLVLTPADTNVSFETWADQGLGLYFGNVVYRADIEGRTLDSEQRIRLDLPGLRGAAQIRVNENAIAHLLEPPYTVDLTEHWNNDHTTIEIEIAGSFTNLLATLSEHVPQPRTHGLTAPPELILTAPRPLA